MKLFKLFPVAVAAFALASCSSDDLKDQAVSTNANALRFSIEDTNTRAGVVGDATDAISALQFRWTKDDRIRVYDENLAMYDVYEYGGTSFAENPSAPCLCAGRRISPSASGRCGSISMKCWGSRC